MREEERGKNQVIWTRGHAKMSKTKLLTLYFVSLTVYWLYGGYKVVMAGVPIMISVKNKYLRTLFFRYIWVACQQPCLPLYVLIITKLKTKFCLLMRWQIDWGITTDWTTKSNRGYLRLWMFRSQNASEFQHLNPEWTDKYCALPAVSVSVKCTVFELQRKSQRLKWELYLLVLCT